MEYYTLITGATGGLGKSICEFLASKKYNLIMVSKQNSILGKEMELSFKEKFNINAQYYDVDLSNYINCHHLITNQLKDIQIKYLVNSIGIIKRNVFPEIEINDWHEVINTNLSSIFYLCKILLPQMEKLNSGKIVNITSQMAYKVHEGASPSYEVSKAGLSALTRHLAKMYAKKNICINNIAPGSIDTGLANNMKKEVWNQIKNDIPAKRLGKSTEVANLVEYLLSENSNYITGSTFHINGGSYIPV